MNRPRKSALRERIEDAAGAVLLAAAIALPAALIDPINQTEGAPMNVHLTMAADTIDDEDAGRWPAMAAEACTEIGAEAVEHGAPRSWVVATCGVAAAAVVAAVAWLARGA